MNIINEFFVSFILIKLYFKFKVCRKIKFPLLWKFYFSKWKFYFSADKSRKIGDIILPLKFYEKMQKAFKIYCFCSLENRVRRIQKIYQEKMTPLKFQQCVQKISPYISLNLRQDLLQSYERKEWQKLIVMLLEYYDKTYKKPDKIDLELNTDDILKAKEELLGYFKTQLLF